MPACEIDYKDTEKGTIQVCLTNPPNETKTKIAGKYACKACQDFIKAEVIKRTGVSRLNAWQALRRAKE